MKKFAVSTLPAGL